MVEHQIIYLVVTCQSDTSEFGYITKLFIISDVDLDSPSYEEFIIGEI